MNTNLSLLPETCLVNVYLHLPVEGKSKKSFYNTCVAFRRNAEIAEMSKKVVAYILTNYQIACRSSNLFDLNPLTFLRAQAILIGENHLIERHRRVNSILVEMLFNPGRTKVLTESGEDSQILYAKEEIRKTVTTWDLDKSWVDFHKDQLITSYRNIKAYFDCCTKEGFNFRKFLDSYKSNRSRLPNSDNLNPQDYFSVAKIVDIACGPRELQQSSIVDNLFNELDRIDSKFFEEVLKTEDSRNDSLCNHVKNSLRSQQFPVVVAGSDHVKGFMVYTLFNIHDVSGLSLIPKDVENEYDLMATENPELNECIQLRKMLKLAKNDTEKKKIFQDNWQLVLKMKSKLLDQDLEKPLLIHYVGTLADGYLNLLFLEKMILQKSLIN